MEAALRGRISNGKNKTFTENMVKCGRRNIKTAVTLEAIPVNTAERKIAECQN
jgi:hypothetical protein